MAQIVKAGDITKVQGTREFTCYLCGTVFTADETEYQFPDYMDVGNFNIETMCICPTCDHPAYRFRTFNT